MSISPTYVASQPVSSWRSFSKATIPQSVGTAVVKDPGKCGDAGLGLYNVGHHVGCMVSDSYLFRDLARQRVSNDLRKYF